IVGWQLTGQTTNPTTGKITLNFSITVQRDIYILNSSAMNIPERAKNQIAANLKQDYSSLDFGYLLEDKTQGDIANQSVKQQYGHLNKDEDYEIMIDINFSANVKFVNSLDEISDVDATIIEYVDGLSGTILGHAILGGDAVQLEKEVVASQDVKLPEFNINGAKVSLHELLHLDGALDLYKTGDNGKVVKDHHSMMGAGTENYNLDASTKKEIAWHYFQATRIANDIANKRRNSADYPSIKELNVNNKSGSRRYNSENSIGDNKKQLEYLRK